MHRNGKKTPFRAAQLGIFAKTAKTPRGNIMAELLPNCSNAQDWNGPSLYNRRKCYVAGEVLTAADRICLPFCQGGYSSGFHTVFSVTNLYCINFLSNSGLK